MKNFLLLMQSTCLPVLLAVVLVLSGCNKDDEEAPQPTESIASIIESTEGLDSLALLLNSFTTLKSRLSSSEHTVFAPTNAAFVKLLESIGLQSMSDLNISLLQDIILYHVVPNSTLISTQLDTIATTLTTEELTFSSTDSILINSEKQPTATTIVSADLRAKNGVVHVVNEVILPGSLRSLSQYFGTVIGLTTTFNFSNQLGGFNTITNYFNSASLIQTLAGTGPFTILGPLDAFFNSFYSNSSTVAEVANYHILDGNVNLAEAERTITTRAGTPLYVTKDGNDIFLNGKFVGDFGLTADNGKVLVMAGVLKPAEPLADVLANAEVLTGQTFSIFRAALRETNLALGTDKTLFVPTDAAFEAAGLISSIDSADIEGGRIDPAVLTNILQTHVINGVTFSSDIVAAESIQANALNEASLTLTYTETTEGGSVTVRSPTTTDAQFVLFNELSDHGAVHFISKVLLP